MNLMDVIDERIIDLEMECTNKKEVLYHLSNKLKSANYIEDVEEFVLDILDREKQGLTGIGNYIAIPHGKSNTVKCNGIAIGRVKNDIAWETLDNNGVRLIFLFAVSNDEQFANNHLRLLAEVATKLGNDEVVDKLKAVETVQELLDIFSK